MNAKSIKGNSGEEINARLLEAKEDGFKPTLAIVFISVKQDINAICNLLDQEGIAIYGSTSNGEFIDEDYSQGTIAILLLDLNPELFFIQFEELAGSNDEKITACLKEAALQRFRKPAFIIAASNLQTDIEDMLNGFTDPKDTPVNVFGGMAGDDHTFKDQFVFTNHQSSKRGIVTVVLDEEKILLKGIATNGWKAVGTEKFVTKSEGSRIYTIDNIPALDLCLKYSGLAIDYPDLAFELGINFPLLLELENGDSVIRPAYLIHWEDHSVVTSGKIPEGSKIRFSLPPDFDVIEKVIDDIRKQKEKGMPDADAVIFFNCGGRLISLGPLIGKEIEGVKNIWNVPMAGMFSNAEFSSASDGTIEMHNLTTCCVVLKEKI